MSSAATALPTGIGGARELVFRFKTPLLAGILTPPEEEDDSRSVVLDLGAPCEALLDRLSINRRLRVEFSDLTNHRGITCLNELESIADDGPSLLQKLLPRPNHERLNLILCWDLPNYLGLDALSLLIDVLSRRAAPGCKLHMLIAYSNREMSAMPARYLPLEGGELKQQLATEKTVNAPRYSPEALGRAVGGFRYQKGVLLANGMQEFVYTWPDEPGADHPF